MELLKFGDWLAQQDESSAFTRARREIALGLRTPTGMGSLHGRSTASPFETESITKKTKKKSKKKVVRKQIPASSLDVWMKEVDALEGSVGKLRQVLDKKKKIDQEAAAKNPVKPDEKKPELPKDKEEEKEESKDKETKWESPLKKPKK